jgi:hypothetical protein
MSALEDDEERRAYVLQSFNRFGDQRLVAKHVKIVYAFTPSPFCSAQQVYVFGC